MHFFRRDSGWAMSEKEKTSGLKNLEKNCQDDNKPYQKKDGGEGEEAGEEIGTYLFLVCRMCVKKIIIFEDIDLNDPEVEAAAAKIQSAFKFRMKGKKNWKDESFANV